jgi:hypothetical protein
VRHLVSNFRTSTDGDGVIGRCCTLKRPELAVELLEDRLQCAFLHFSTEALKTDNDRLSSNRWPSAPLHHDDDSTAQLPPFFRIYVYVPNPETSQ